MATRWVEHARILEDGRAEVLWQGKDGVLIRLMFCRSRCRDTAEPAVNRWGLLHKDGVPVIEISLLAQPESGDDLGIFAPVEGYKSNAFHWKDWALRSKLMMVAVMNCPGFSTGDPRDWTLVTTHRLLAATFLYLARTPDRPIETAETSTP